MSNKEMKGKADQTISKDPKGKDKTAISERERYKGKLTKAENKAQETIIKARSKNQGHEPVSDQKSHEYH
jgi:hypothetical protein